MNKANVRWEVRFLDSMKAWLMYSTELGKDHGVQLLPGELRRLLSSFLDPIYYPFVAGCLTSVMCGRESIPWKHSCIIFDGDDEKGSSAALMHCLLALLKTVCDSYASERALPLLSM